MFSEATEAPTIEATEAPETEAPTTEATEAPTTEATEAPTTEATEAPETTEAPTTEATEAPTTEAPTTEATEAPTTEATETPETPETTTKPQFERRDTIKSTNYPRNYDNNANETFELDAMVTGNKIKIVFEDFRLENSTNCANDWVEIIENTTATAEEANTRTMFCGDNIPDEYISETNSLKVNFKSDATDTDRGFKFSWYEGLGEETSLNIITETFNIREGEETTKFCAGTATDWDCCLSVDGGKCGYGRGDCDADDDCAGNLK